MKIQNTQERDKFKATWISHSSIGDFLKCPRLYYLHNVYKNPKTKKKVSLTSPALALGSAVHLTLEPLAHVKAEDRMKENLLEIFNKNFDKMRGKIGGFSSVEQEEEYKERGERMIERVIKDPKMLNKKALRTAKDLPNFFLTEEDEIILCGKIDWMEYDETQNGIIVWDFKTGKNEEGEESLQLPIYQVLLKNIQKRALVGARYWYLEQDKVVEKDLPDYQESFDKILEIGREIAKTRKEKKYDCPKGEKGCYACKPYEDIVSGKATFVGNGEYNQELYII